MFPQKILIFYSWDLYIENSSVLSRFFDGMIRNHTTYIADEVRECSDVAWMQGS